MSYESTQYPESLRDRNTRDYAVMKQMLKDQRKKLVKQIAKDNVVDFSRPMQKSLKARLDEMRKYLQHNYGACE